MNKVPQVDIQPEHQEAYARDGVVLVKGAFDMDWVNLLLAGWERMQKQTPDE